MALAQLGDSFQIYVTHEGEEIVSVFEVTADDPPDTFQDVVELLEQEDAAVPASPHRLEK